MKRSKVLRVVLGTSAFLTIVVACIVVICLRVSEQRDRGQKTIDEVLERQKIKHEGVEHARAQDYLKIRHWQAIGALSRQ